MQCRLLSTTANLPVNRARLQRLVRKTNLKIKSEFGFSSFKLSTLELDDLEEIPYQIRVQVSGLDKSGEKLLNQGDYAYIFTLTNKKFNTIEPVIRTYLLWQSVKQVRHVQNLPSELDDMPTLSEFVATVSKKGANSTC